MSLYYKNRNKLSGPLAIYSDDMLATGLKSFKKLTDEIAKIFEFKPMEYLPFDLQA